MLVVPARPYPLEREQVGRVTVVVSARGTRIVLPRSSGWSVLEVETIFAQIDALPETAAARSRFEW